MICLSANKIVGENIEWRYRDDEAIDSSMGSAKALRAFMNADIEMVVCVYGTRASLVVLNVKNGSVFKKQVLELLITHLKTMERLSQTCLRAS